jgi:carbon starvation protein
MTASFQKIWDPSPALGFLAHARYLAEQIVAGAVPADQILRTRQLIFNDRLDAAVTFIFAALVVVILIESGRNWWLYASGRKRVVLAEAPVELSRLTA